MECISTHAPRTGSDRFIPMRITRGGNFNPRSPHGERRTVFVMPCVVAPTFQPTLPARGATGAALPPPSARGISTHAPRTGSDGACQWHPDSPVHFNPRSPHGERRARGRAHNASDDFNPRSPHGERQVQLCRHLQRAGFQPTLPARGATEAQPCAVCIYADFNPRSPHGERRNRARSVGNGKSFQPTLPARGATATTRLSRSAGHCISTHAPRTGSDQDFVDSLLMQCGISTHAPRTGSDDTTANIYTHIDISTHAPRTGSDL